MPQAKLPDINHAWVWYRAYGFNCLREKNYIGAIAAVNEINALFPEEYRVEINTQKYLQSAQDTITVICSKCNKESNLSEVKIFNLLLTQINSIIMNRTTEKVWICQNCKSTNYREKTQMTRKVKKKPNYNQLIPEAPKYIDGIQGRTTYHNNMVKWFYDAIEELDHQLGKYRAEYKPEDSGDEANTTLSGDEDAD